MKKLIFLLLIPFIAFADTAGLTWEAPTERQDNSPLDDSEIGGFRIYTDQGAMLGSDIPADARAFSVPLDMMGQPVYMTTFDTDGRESTPSNIVVIPQNTTSPKAPNVTVTFTISQ